MRAIVMTRFGSPQVLQIQEIPKPEPLAGEVRIRVRAVFVSNTRDVSTRAGLQPYFSHVVQPPHILGGDCAGIIDAVGEGVSHELVGTRVVVSANVTCGACQPCREMRRWRCSDPQALGIHRPGSYAEFVVLPVANVEQLPDTVTFEQAAVLMANGPLAEAQLDRADVGPGTTVLVTGASGSVGNVVVALAARRGARVIALARRRAAFAPLLAAGAEAVLDSGDDSLANGILDATGGVGVAVAIDNIAVADVWARYVSALAPGACVVISGAIGTEPLAVNPRLLYLRGQSLVGLRTADARHSTAFWEEVRSRGLSVPNGLITQFPLEQAADIHAAVERGDKLGHYVLTID